MIALREKVKTLSETSQSERNSKYRTSKPRGLEIYIHNAGMVIVLLHLTFSSIGTD